MGPHQIVFSNGQSSIRRSAVTSGKFSARAVAAIVRSAGSEEKSDGKNVVKAAISVVTGLMKMPSTSFAMVCSTVPMGSIRFAAMSRANSTRVIAEMAKPS